MSTSSGSAGSAPAPVPLKSVVAAAVSPAGCARRASAHARGLPGAVEQAPHPPRPHPRPRPVAQVRRWFEDTLQEALCGDAKQQALLSQMYLHGYGCQRDEKAAAEWAERARQRGYRMQGVFCEL
jgi:TPR repeat protein